MNNDPTRREFLRISGLSTASLLAASSIEMPASAETTAAPGKTSLWITDDNQRLAQQSAPQWRKARAKTPGNAVVVNPSKRLQPILGFGAAFTDSACFTFNRLDPAARETLFHDLFGPSEMGLNVCRTCIGSSDYAAEMYSFDEGDPDPELKRFSIEHDRAYLLPILREARKANPDLFLFSSPWSPPGWMKPNKSMLGGNMQRRYMSSYANYFLKFLQGYQAEGVPVNAVTVQNEVDTDQDGRMPACTWPQEYEVDFVRQHLGPLFEKNAVKTKIWIIDHNYNLWGRAIGELETPDVRKYTNAIAWHGYVGKPEWMLRVQAVYPDVEMYWTEGGPDISAPNYSTDWVDWSRTFTDVLRNGCRSITGWNLALDEHGKPNIGPFSCGGLVTIHSQTREITRSGQYWAFAHFSRFARRGAHVLECTGPSDIAPTAFENPDGSRIVVIANAGPARNVEISIGEHVATLRLSGNSVATVAVEK